jgi:phosphatidylglycerophosphate synthase
MEFATLATQEWISIIIIFCFIVALLIYGLYSFKVGRKKFQRISKQGSSIFISKQLMELVYLSIIPIGKGLTKIKISPNRITFLSLFTGLISGALLAKGSFGYATIFIILTGMMDVLDGMMARAINKTAPSGAVIDSSVDRYVDFFFLAGLAIFWRHHFELVIITLFAINGSFMVSYSTAKAEALQQEPPRGNMKRTDRFAYILIATILTPLSLKWLEPQFQLATAKAFPLIFVVAFLAVGANLSAFFRLRAICYSVDQDYFTKTQRMPNEHSTSISGVEQKDKKNLL